ncbi:MAG: response regulator [Elusimicrobia bacterium]|nr:response regulator [Elusimicrobiota bacterium]
MVADDTQDIVELLKDILTSRGHQVVSVPDGVQMIEKAKTWRPQLIIADLMMPGAYGSAAYKALMDDPVTASIPVIFLTAVPEQQARRVVPPEGPKTKHMFKPVMPHALLAAVNAILGASAAPPPAPPQAPPPPPPPA